MIKKIIYTFIRFSGILRVWTYINRNKVNILMLHGVMDTDYDSSWNPLWQRVSLDRLDRHLGMLSRYCKFISLDDAIDMLAGKKQMEHNCVAVTFDDGYRNNVTRALPILKKYGITATVFVATAYISDKKPYPIDRLDYVLQKVNMDKRTIDIGSNSIVIDASSRERLVKSYYTMRLMFRDQYKIESVNIQKFNDLALKLEEESESSLLDIYGSDEWTSLLKWDEISKTNHVDIEYESHTIDHYRLAQLETEEMRHQLCQSKSILENELNEPCKYICYPIGSYNDKVMEISEECGYKAGVTTETGLNKKGDNLFALKRISFPNKGSDNESIVHLTGLLNTLSEVKSIIK